MDKHEMIKFMMVALLSISTGVSSTIINRHNLMYQKIIVPLSRGITPTDVSLKGNIITYTNQERRYKLDLDSKNRNSVCIDEESVDPPLGYNFIDSTRVTMEVGRIGIKKDRGFIPVTDEDDLAISFMVDRPRKLIYSLVRNERGEGRLKSTLVLHLGRNDDAVQTVVVNRLRDNVTSFYVDESTGSILMSGKLEGNAAMILLKYMPENDEVQRKTFTELLNDSMRKIVNRTSYEFQGITPSFCNRFPRKHPSTCNKLKRVLNYTETEGHKLLLRHSIELSEARKCEQKPEDKPIGDGFDRATMSGQLSILVKETLKLSNSINATDVRPMFKGSYLIPKEEMYAYKCGLDNAVTDLQIKYEELVVRMLSLYENLKIIQNSIDGE